MTAPRLYSRLLLLTTVAALLVAVSDAAHAVRRPKRIQVTVGDYDPLAGVSGGVNHVCFKLMQEDPTLEILPYRAIRIPGGPGMEAPRYMAIAARIAPDVTQWIPFFLIRKYSQEGFLLPLNEFIGQDRNGDGTIGLDEATWPDWKYVPPYYRSVATWKGRVYALPTLSYGRATLLFRKDLFRKAGLPVNRDPRDWDELFLWLQRLTDPAAKVPGAMGRGRYGISLGPEGFWWIPWLWAAGGDEVQQSRTNPRTGKTYWYPKEELQFLDPETGESLRDQPGRWKATFASEAGMKAVEFYRRLVFTRWIRDPVTREPINLSKEDLARGFDIARDGRRVRFTRQDVIKGVIRTAWGSDQGKQAELLERGEVAMVLWVASLDWLKRIPPENLGVMPVPPATTKDRPSYLGEHHWYGLSPELAGPENAERRRKAWKVLSTIAGSKGARWEMEHLARQGMASFLDPTMLQRFGLTEYLDEVPKDWRERWARIQKYGRSEPPEGSWINIHTQILQNEVLSLAMTQEDFDWRAALADAERQANAGMMFPRTDEELRPYRPWGWLAVGAWLLMMGAVASRLYRSLRPSVSDGELSRGVRQPGATWWPVLLLAPALLLILVWQYYPLLQGALIAFKDYRIASETRWVGVDNFVNIFLDGKVWVYLRQTFKFAALTLVLGFFTPLALAILLAEVPRAKVFFRTLFFLPQISSSLVIMFLWKQFYDPAPHGLLNRLMLAAAAAAQAVGIRWDPAPIDWLGNTATAMPAVILPGVWASAGLSSLVYLAAMKSIPDDLYEAAEMDGAGIWRKLRHITVPTLGPLLIINFIGAFIGTFHSMGNILVMTAGGPGNETMVMSLAIWYEAFAFLRFGTATAMAWILGSLLIGFTLWQLRILKRVEFRRVEAA